MYAKSFIDDMPELGKLFGPHNVLLISNDTKSTAATLQARNLMHLEYKARFLDYNFVVDACHNLIPSVCGVYDINLKGEVAYSGDTFIRIRSGKHVKS